MKHLPVMLLLLLLACGGCKIVDENRVNHSGADTMPWNSRAHWEGSTLGVPIE